MNDAPYLTLFKKGLRPLQNLTVDKWADQYREISKKSGSEPGRWRTSRTPYLKEIMECMSPQSHVQEVIVIKGTQLGFTEVANNVVGYYIHQDPCPIGFWMPTEKLAEKHSKKKIQPTIDETPVLKELVAERRSRDSSSTILEKSFPGGSLSIAGSNSGASFRSDSYRIAILDDVDGFVDDVDGEGSPIELAKNRTDTFGSKRKLYINSTPTIRGMSHIETEFEDSDQRLYFVPCPECDHYQPIEWDNIKFEHRDTQIIGEVQYQCKECGSLISEYHKTEMMEKGKWVAQNPNHSKAGFKLSSFYSPVGWRSWKDIAEEFLKANKKAKTGDKRLLKRWINTRLAESYEEAGETIGWQGIYSRREDYKVPNDVLVVTATVDTQDDRLEIDFKGWTDGEESYGLGQHLVHGKPNTAKVWHECDEILKTIFVRDDKVELQCAITLIDSGGHYATEVYAFTKPREHRRVFAIKGSSIINAPLFQRPNRVGKIKALLYQIGTDTAKTIVFDRLKVEEYGDGYMHFNTSYDEEYCKQITSEKLIIRVDKNGRTHHVWKKTRARNEALDLNAYQVAAIKILNPKWESIKKALSKKSQPKEDEPIRIQPDERQPFARPNRTNKPRGSWVKNY